MSQSSGIALDGGRPSSRTSVDRSLGTLSTDGRQAHPRDADGAWARCTWLTGRGASRRLMGVVGSDEQARLLLRTGAAGPGEPTTGGVLYDEQRVEDLAARPRVAPAELSRGCPQGLYICRVSRRLAIDVTDPWAVTAERLSRKPPMPTMAGALLSVRVGITGRLPWVATVSGFVVFGADLTGFEELPGGDEQRFRLEPPGPWFAGLEGRWLRNGRGGRPWHLWDPWLSGLG